ncbi:MAG TPA: hypothetical protein VGD81_13945 [Opitutaceae bacterium]
MNPFRTCALAAALAAPALGFSQTSPATIEGVFAVGGGGFLQSGNRANFQSDLQHRKDGFGGIEEFRLTKELSKDTIFTLDARALYGDEDYLFDARIVKEEVGYLTFGYQQFRVWYDGTGGYFPPTNTIIHLNNEDLYVDRGSFWFEAATTRADRPNLKIRYEHQFREGKKGSTIQGDYNVPVFGTRSFVPSLYKLDETRDIVTVDLSREAEDYQWVVGARYDRSELDNQRRTNRQPGAAADRKVTSKDQTVTDMFSAHAYTERKFGEKFTFSTGGMITTLDTNLEGSRIYGQGYDPVYDPAYFRRQQRDEGFYDLGGGSQMKQYVFNANLVYQPAKHWTIRPALRFESTRTDTLAHFIETNVGAGPAFVSVGEELEADSDKDWTEFTESVEVRYTGIANWTHSLKAEWLQGDGELSEEIAEHTGVIDLDRDTDITRLTQKYAYTANWYARPGLSLAGQYYYKVRVNDNDNVRDSTVSTADRYPAYITDQDFETHDFNVRLSWRPASLVSLVTRYDYQNSTILSQEAGLGPVESSDYTSHIIAQSVTVNPIPRLYVTASANVTFDQVATPAIDTGIVKNGDNNYFNASLGAGYALSDRDDLYADYYRYQADNYINNSAVSMPYGADEEQDVATLTWVRRQSEHLIYTFKYTYANFTDRAAGGSRDYEAHGLYGKVQYRF